MRYKVTMEAPRTTVVRDFIGDVDNVVTGVIGESMHIRNLSRITITREDGAVASSSDGQFINANFPVGKLRQAFGCLWLGQRFGFAGNGRKAGGAV